jgi:hypothetical protein
MRKGDEMLFCNGGSRFIANPIELAVLQKWFAIPTISHQLAASRHAVVDVGHFVRKQRRGAGYPPSTLDYINESIHFA